MFKWFKTSSLEPLSVSMAGAKLGDRVLIVGCSDPSLIAALAGKAGLTGRTCAVDESADAANKAGAFALREGVLAETSGATLTALEFETGTFDLVVVRDVLGRGQQSPDAIVAEAARVLRPGGRCLVIDTIARSSLAGILGGQPTTADHAVDPVAVLTSQGFAAARVLAERDGLRFAEAVKKNAGTVNRDTQP
jgi:ubiquinone/menaquinone biosynthesis C-methylase UbiE